MGKNSPSRLEHFGKEAYGRESHFKSVLRPQLKLLSNEELVKYGIRKKLIVP
jgi:hypothetical protein